MALKLYGISIQLFLCSDAGDLWAEGRPGMPLLVG